MNELKEKLIGLLGEDRIRYNEPMKEHTTFRIGGPADYFVMPKDQKEIISILALCKEKNTPVYIIGNGSNLLVGDKGFRGLIMQIGKGMDEITFEENGKVRAGAGVMLSKLAAEIMKQSLTGFEFASGIPGTLGGAVYMNAGAYGGEIKDCIVNATVIDREGNLKILSKEELELSYRNSIIAKENMIVVEALFQFEKGNQEEIRKRMSELNERRRDKQPLNYPSAGSTFKRPEGYFAGKLIEDAGLRGFRIGGAMVSEKHCGFVVNVGEATAADVNKLMEEVDRQVYEKFSVHLEPEVRKIGE